MSNALIIIRNVSAWKMQPPAMYGSFHILAVIVMSALAVWGARLVRKRGWNVTRVLAVTGWALIVLEIFKQLFLCYVVNGGAYDYWFFPFLLCSVPMYLCVLLPRLGRGGQRAGDRTAVQQTGGQGGLRAAVLTFLASYTFVSAVATFVYPEDLLRSYAALTVHGFLWHGLLLFLSLTVVLTAAADLTVRGFARATALYLALCCVAVALNVALEPLAAARMAGPLAHAYPNMFYLSPYHFSGQPLIGTVQRAAGIPAGLALYIAATVAFSAGAAAAFARGFHHSKEGVK